MAEVARDESVEAQSEIKPSTPVKPITSETHRVQEKENHVEGSQQRSVDILTGTQSLLTVVILVLACIVAFSSRLFAVIRFESIIHEFDPW